MSRVIQRALDAVAQGRARLAHFREIAPYYPVIKYRKEYGILYVMTKVRIEREGKWYTNLHVQSAQDEKGADVQILNMLLHNVYFAQVFYKVSPHEVPDEDQISEEDRLRRDYPMHFPKNENTDPL